MTKLGVGIIGCGWVAEEHIKAFEHDPRSEVRSLASRNRANAERYRDRYRLACSIETDFERAVARNDVDLVVVCSPHDRHTEHVVAAAEAGKHVLIEKPAAITPAGLRRQQDAVERSGVKTLVSFVLHWNPLLMTVDGLIDKGALGHVFLVEVDYLHRIWMTPEEKWYASRATSGTALLTAGCHAVDALRWFARSEAVEVSAWQVRTDNPVEYPGTISLNVRFENGTIGRSVTSFDVQMPYRFNVGVYGTEGTIRNDRIFAPGLFTGQDDFLTLPCVRPESGDVAHHPFRGQASHFLDCILADQRPFPDLEDAARTQKLCFAADRAAEEQRPVMLSEME